MYYDEKNQISHHYKIIISQKIIFVKSIIQKKCKFITFFLFFGEILNNFGILVDKKRFMWYTLIVARLLGQVVKTLPSHGSIGGSNPPGVTNGASGIPLAPFFYLEI